MLMWLRCSLVLASLSAPRFPTPADAGPRPGREDPDPKLWSRLHRVENAFLVGDANTLRSSFSTGRVQMSFRGLRQDRGSFGPGQAELIFRHIFEEFRTQDFAFRKGDVNVSIPGTAFARGRWVRRRQPGGQEFTDNLTFTLREESGDWRILEIRSSP